MTSPTPQDHIEALKSIPGSGPSNGPTLAAQEAVEWAIPILEAQMAVHSWGSLAKALEFMEDYAYRPEHSREDGIKLRQVAMLLTTAPFSLSEGRRLRSIAESATSQFFSNTIESLKRKSDSEKPKEQHMAHANGEIGGLLAFFREKMPDVQSESETAVDTAIRLLSFQVPAYVTEHAEKLLALSKSATRTSREVDQALSEAAMILKSNQWANGETARLETFIEETYPGELDGMSPVTVAIRLLGERTQRSTTFRHMTELTEYMMRHHADTMSEAAKTSDRVTVDAVLKLLAELTERRAKDAPRPGARCGGCDQMFATDEAVNPRPVRMWICATCQNQGITQKHLGAPRLPLLDAIQIPMTQEQSIEILRGLLVTIQREYPYAPAPSPEQWATTREALIFVLSRANREPPQTQPLADPIWEKCESCGTMHMPIAEPVGLQTYRNLHKAWDDLREIQRLLGAKSGEKALDAARALAAKPDPMVDIRARTAKWIMAIEDMEGRELSISLNSGLPDSVRLVALENSRLLSTIVLLFRTVTDLGV